MADEDRTYTDEEFSVILRKATELAEQSPSSRARDGGLTLSEIKSAAAQAGIDPMLVEQAAQTLARTASESWSARLAGGPLRHAVQMQLPITLDQEKAERMMSAVRIAGGLAGAKDVGHASDMGLAWHDGGEYASLRVTARPVGNSTVVQIELDRRGSLGIVVMISGFAIIFTVLFGLFGVYQESPALGMVVATGGTGIVLAAARRYWSASTRAVRARIATTLDALSKAIPQSTSDD